MSNLPFAINSETVSNDVALLSGTAPLGVKTLWFNGVEWPITWSTVSNWNATIPLRPGTNQFTVQGVDLHGQPVTGASNSIAILYTGAAASPVGQVVLNEIMYEPTVPGADYLELYNNSPSLTLDLSGWQLSGLGYTFPNGSLIAPRSFLVLAANRSAFASAYGGRLPLFDTYSASLSTSGQRIALVTPGVNGLAGSVVTQVEYNSQAPWPGQAAVPGSSLQLIDPSQDNWRVGNWAASTSSSGSGIPGSLTQPFTPATPGLTNADALALPAFPPLWINEVEADNLTGITNSAGQRSGWLELFNPSTNTIALDGLYLSTDYHSLTNWPFPAGAVIQPGQFLVIFADGQSGLSASNQLHTSFTLPSGSGSLALTRIFEGQAQVLDYIDYQNLPADHSFGSVPDGQSFVRQEFAFATPGAPNNARLPPSFIAYGSAGSVYSQNFDALPNPGLVSINTANPVLIDGVTYALANPFDFAAPIEASGSGGLGLGTLSGWYGLGNVGSKFGATDGDQTTGGVISFGTPGSANRALGLLATSSTGGTAFGARFLNQTGRTLNNIGVELTGELWRQSNLPKLLECYYFVDPSGAAPFSTSLTAFLPSLDVSFATSAAAVGGVAVDGTAAANQTNLSVLNQAITNWPPGATLWLVWEMADPTGKSQGLAIDNLLFAASDQPLAGFGPALTVQTAGDSFLVSWTSIPGRTYQIEYTDDLSTPNWTALGPPIIGNGDPLTLTNNSSLSTQRFYRLRVIP